MSNNDKIQRAVRDGEYVGNVAPLLADELRRRHQEITACLEAFRDGKITTVREAQDIIEQIARPTRA